MVTMLAPVGIVSADLV